jgi:GT2 family glycosyltransferase
MMTPPDLSIIIINWNTRDLLKDCLASLESCTGALRTEVIVVDNGSIDGSQKMVEASFPSVTLLKNRSNLGFAKACNIALRVARGRHFLLLNSDTVILPGALENAVAFLDGNRNVGIAGVQLLNEDGSRQNSIASFPSLLTELFNKSLLRMLFPGRYPGKESEYADPVDVDSVIGACLFARREATEEIGFLDERFFFFLEETDWCMRMKKGGWRVVHIPGVSIYHLQGRTAEKVNVRARIEYFRSRYLYFLKHHGEKPVKILKYGLVMKTSVNLVANTLATVASLWLSTRSRRKVNLYWSILRWHIRGCPSSEGIAQQ